MKYLTLSAMVVIFVIAIVPGSLLGDFVHGYVRDSTTNQPIVNARVDGQRMFTAHQFHVRTDSAGYYTVTDTLLPSGSWQITASHPFYYSLMRTENLPTQNNINFNLTPQ